MLASAEIARHIPYLRRRFPPRDQRLHDMNDTPSTPPKAASTMSRRALLNIAWLTALGLLLLQGLRMALDLFTPRFKKGQFGGVFEVGAVTELPSPDDPPANFPEGKFWLLRQGDQLKAFYKNCTHLDCLFNWSPQEGRFICPCHGSQFDRDGVVLSGPAPRALDEFVVQILLPDGTLVAETDPELGLLMPPIIAPPENNGENGEGDGAEAAPQPANAIPAKSIVLVDTGRKIANVAGGKRS